MQAEEANFVTNDDEFDCPVCFTGIPAGEGVRLRGCLHQFCKWVYNLGGGRGRLEPNLEGRREGGWYRKGSRDDV